MPLYTLYELLIYIFWLSFAKALLLHRDIQPFAEYAVAPLVGAWIETDYVIYAKPDFDVAPLVGAWIETSKGYVGEFVYSSHPSWVRGLKPPIGEDLQHDTTSHPSWVRGLKQSLLNEYSKRSLGRTPRGCVD